MALTAATAAAVVVADVEVLWVGEAGDAAYVVPDHGGVVVHLHGDARVPFNHDRVELVVRVRVLVYDLGREAAVLELDHQTVCKQTIIV